MNDAHPNISGFDDYEFRLGDEMRGRRAAMGKSLLDVERDLRIRPVWVNAIEKSDPKTFESSWLVAGHLKSYARYLDMDPEDAYRRFCAECGLDSAGNAQGVAEKSRARLMSFFGGRRKKRRPSPTLPWQKRHNRRNRLAIDAAVSAAALMMLAGGILYVGWTVYDEVQRAASLQENPAVLSNLANSPGTELANVPRFPAQSERQTAAGANSAAAIGLSDPDRIGFFAPGLQPEGVELPPAPESGTRSQTEVELALTDQEREQSADYPIDRVIIVPARPSWIRVTDSIGNTLFEKVLTGGEQYDVPELDLPPVLRAGNAGSLYFVVNGQVFGPAGEGQSVAKNVELAAESIMAEYERLVAIAVPQEIKASVSLAEASDQLE